jgi:hypothetical protein
MEYAVAMPPRMFKGKKLLVASIGVAAVSYACNKEQPRPEQVGNLMAPMPTDSGAPVATPDTADAGVPSTDIGIVSGNLVAPPPPPPVDAGSKAASKPDAGKKK